MKILIKTMKETMKETTFCNICKQIPSPQGNFDFRAYMKHRYSEFKEENDERSLQEKSRKIAKEWCEFKKNVKTCNGCEQITLKIYMNNLIERHYPESRIPKWVDKSGFYLDLETQLYKLINNQLELEGYDEIFEIDDDISSFSSINLNDWMFQLNSKFSESYHESYIIVPKQIFNEIILKKKNENIV